MSVEAAAMEFAERVPCATCQVPVDPLRAPQAAVIDERYHFYCSRECRERGRPAPRRPRGRAAGLHREPPSLAETLRMLAIPLESVPPALRSDDRLPSPPDAERPSAARSRDESPDPVAPGVAASATVFALLFASFPSLPLRARAVVLGASALAGLTVSLRELWLQRRSRGVFAWAASLLGALLPFGDALCSTGERVPASLRETAVLAAVGPVVAWFARTRRAEAIARVAFLQSALPHRARIVGRDATEPELVDAARLRAGAEVLVGSGAIVPVDGVVRDGEAQVRLWPGAREVRVRRPGDAVLAGAQVLDGALRILATRAGAEVSWARLARMMTTVGAAPFVVLRARTIGDRAPFVTGALAVLAGVVHAFWTGGDGLLAAACVLALTPCAVAAPATESPFATALAAAARRGIVFRDLASVEAAARVGTVALCLRGTVTQDRMELTEVVSLGARADDELVATAAAVEEADAASPMARALTEAVTRRGLRLQNIRRPAVLPGLGVTAVSATGDPVLVGNRRLLLSEGVSVAPAEATAAAIEGAGRTAVFVAIDGRVEGVLGFEDPVREEVRSAVQAMIDAGYDIALVGGASRATVEAVGAMLDVTNLRPEVLPDERAAVVRALAEVGHGAAVIGRPGRDGAMLAAADVAISVDAAGGAGTDTAMALASDDLRDAAAALRMARRARSRSVAVLVWGVGCTVLGGLMAVSLPTWGLTIVAVTTGVVLTGQALIVRDPEGEVP